jgi:membrane protease YdiL (CAAX protease family)
MDLANLALVGLALALAIYIIVIANRSPNFGTNSGVQGVLWALLAINFALGALALVNAILSGAGALPTEGATEVALPAGIISFALAAFVMAIGALSIRSPQFRARLRSVLGSDATFDPNSLLHTTALILILLLIASNLITFFLVGGIEGMADSIAVDGIDFIGVLLQQLLWIAAALLGVGLFTRRTLPAVMERLGLRIPNLREVGAGVVTAVVAYLVAIVVSALWIALTSPEQFADQTAASQQISAAFGSLPLAFGVALSVAIGEEIFFRGAFQPVFGNLLTSIFFAIIHTQYALTPATAIIFVVSLLLGWLRQRYSTSSAIIAHFLYNFIQLALAVLANAALNGTTP